MQAPLTHMWPVAHTSPHIPQLLESVDVLTHPEGQSVSPAGHTHMLIEHDAPIGHTPPHIPQLFGSVDVLTQVEPQRVPPMGHTH